MFRGRQSDVTVENKTKKNWRHEKLFFEKKEDRDFRSPSDTFHVSPYFAFSLRILAWQEKQGKGTAPQQQYTLFPKKKSQKFARRVNMNRTRPKREKGRKEKFQFSSCCVASAGSISTVLRYRTKREPTKYYRFWELELFPRVEAKRLCVHSEPRRSKGKRGTFSARGGRKNFHHFLLPFFFLLDINFLSSSSFSFHFFFLLVLQSREFLFMSHQQH